MTATYDTTLAPNRRIAFTTRVLPALLYAAAVFYAGLIRMPALPEGGVVATDKLLHGFVFGGLALLIARACHWLKRSPSVAKQLVLGMLGSSLLGMLLELCQTRVPYRSADVWDWVADTIGAILAVSLAFPVWRWARRGRG